MLDLVALNNRLRRFNLCPQVVCQSTHASRWSRSPTLCLLNRGRDSRNRALRVDVGDDDQHLVHDEGDRPRAIHILHISWSPLHLPDPPGIRARARDHQYLQRSRHVAPGFAPSLSFSPFCCPPPQNLTNAGPQAFWCLVAFSPSCLSSSC